jgi:hypothetical protein
MVGGANKFGDTLSGLAARAKLFNPPTLRHIVRSVNYNRLALEQEFLQRYPLGDDEWGLMFPHGIGDLYITCGYARAIRAAYGGTGFVTYVKPSVPYVATLFDAVTRVVPVTDFDMKNLQQPYLFEKGRLVSIFPVQRFWNMIGYKGFHFLDYFCLFYGLPFGTLPDAPRPQTKVELETARGVLSALGVRPGRTVLLAPHAVSTAKVHPDLWSQLTLALKARGFDVVLNSPPGDVPASAAPAIASASNAGAVPVDVPIEGAFALGEAAGWVISLRSGFCDLLAHSPCRLTVVYPDMVHKGGPFIDGFGFRNSGLRSDVHELVMTDDIAGMVRTIVEEPATRG